MCGLDSTLSGHDSVTGYFISFAPLDFLKDGKFLDRLQELPVTTYLPAS